MDILKVVSRERPEDSSVFDLWNDPAWQRYGHVRSLALVGESFRGRLELGSVGFLSVCRITATAHRVEHAVERMSSDSIDRLKILAQTHGTCRFQQGRNTVDLASGDFIVYDPAASYSFTNLQAVEQVVVSIPMDRLPLGHDASTKVLGQRLSARSGGARLALALLNTTLQELQNCDANGIKQVAELICSLVVDAVREQAGGRSPVSLKLVLRTRVRDFIESNLSDPELGINLIAQRLNCSKRYLYDVFDDGGLTISRYIWMRRLERCKDELVNSDCTKRSLTNIALSWGFSSAAHFSKAFKQRFGASPSDFRV